MWGGGVSGKYSKPEASYIQRKANLYSKKTENLGGLSLKKDTIMNQLRADNDIFRTVVMDTYIYILHLIQLIIIIIC